MSQNRPRYGPTATMTRFLPVRWGCVHWLRDPLTSPMLTDNEIGKGARSRNAPPAHATALVPPTMHLCRPTQFVTRTDHRQRASDGFALAEFLVVCAVITILTALVMPSLLGSRTSGRRGQAIAAARPYATAVSAFMLDHRGRVPVAATPDWPATDAGPVNFMGVSYLHDGPPEAVADGLVAVATGTSTVAPPPNARALVTYQWLDSAHYRVVVERVTDSGTTYVCEITNAGGGTPC